MKVSIPAWSLVLTLIIGGGCGLINNDNGSEEDITDTVQAPPSNTADDANGQDDDSRKLNTDTSPPNGETGRLVGFTAAHNEIRRQLGLEDLTWSPTVAAFAEEWAVELMNRGCDMEHRPSSGPFAQQYGENLAWNLGFQETAKGVTSRWASEESSYNYSTNTCSSVCGHYTQIVWRDTQELGCALRICDDGAEIWVCNYNPPGNYIGQKPY